MGEIIKRKIKRLNWKAKIAILLCFTLIFSTFMFEGWYKPRPAYAAISVAKGTFARRTTAGTQSITGIGFQPKLVIFFWTGNTTSGTSAANGMMGIGFAGGSPIANASVATVAQDNVATTNTGWIESATYCIQSLNTTPAMIARASLQSLDADGFTLNWASASGNAEIIHYIAIGGADITNVKVGQFNGPNVTGTYNYTSVGFQPDFVMLVHPDRTATTLDAVQAAGALNIGMFTATTQGATGWGSRDGSTTVTHAHTLSDAHAVYGIRRSAADQIATFSSMLTNGFSLNFTTVGGSAPYIYLAIQGGNHKIGSFAKRTSAGTQAITGLGFTPSALMLFSHNSSAANGTVETANPAASLSIGAAAGTANGTVWMHDRTILNTDVNMISYNNAVMKMGASNNGITDYGQATLQSFDTDGFTLNWSSSDGTARRVLYWALGGYSDTTPPTAGTVTVTPDVSGYTTSSPTITTQFTDNETNITSCEYTTNGSTWSPATLTGSAPTWTCTATPTGLTGSLTINMRATSSGGTGTGTPISRTVDSTAPVDGTLTATAGDGQVGLSWSGFSDAGVGLSTTDPYKLVYSTTGYPNAGCTNGTDITAVTTQNTYTHTGLTNGTTYYYRLCAIDQFGNTSPGVTASATPALPPPWQIGSCSGCHGYTGSFNDGTARNNPVGTFPGSHNKHVVGYSQNCSKCHVTPATETSADFNHRNGLIQMASPINGNTGASYSKGTSWTQTNTFTGGTCSNTYCHSDGTSVITGTIPSNTSPAWGGTTTCQSCHGVGGNDDGRPNYTNGTPKRNTHGDTANNYGLTHKSQPCTTCHTGISGTPGNYTITDTTTHNNGQYNLQASLGYNQSTGQCSTPNCHGSAVWGGKLGCIDCHANAISSPVAQSIDSTVTQRRAIVPEFQQASNHVRNKAGGVTNADCGVCHMEGNASDGSINTTYHKNGYVELRDPDTGTIIKQAIWGGTGAGSFTDGTADAKFVRFSRNLATHLEGDTNYLNLAGLQKNHCLKCHDAGGATSALARVSTGTATNPFGANAANMPGGRVVDVYADFASTRAYHPILAKQNNSYAANTRMNAPWNITKTNGTTTSWGYLMTCWDCHAPNGATGTLTSTVTAHGSAISSTTTSNNAVELRGYVWRTGAVGATNNTTLCIICHAGYDTSTASNHNTGSALASTTNNGMSLYLRYACYYCHSSNATKPNRPTPASDVHGYNTRANGTAFAQPNYGYGFIRAEGFYSNGYYHSVANVGGTGYTAQCTGYNGTNGSTACTRNNMGTYTPGGYY